MIWFNSFETIVMYVKLRDFAILVFKELNNKYIHILLLVEIISNISVVIYL